LDKPHSSQAIPFSLDPRDWRDNHIGFDRGDRKGGGDSSDVTLPFGLASSRSIDERGQIEAAPNQQAEKQMFTKP
jgi:hypothetical protein